MESLKTELVLEDGKRDRRGRRLRSAGKIAECVGAYERSGLTMAAFAREAGIKYPTFAAWVKRHGGGALKPAGAAPPRFAEVALPFAMTTGCADAALSVTLPDGMIVRGSDATQVAVLVRALSANR